jgi:hypothetical protein
LQKKTKFIYIGGTFRKLIQESEIKGGGLKTYCITRWTTSSESVNSVITLKPILEKVIILIYYFII